MGITLSVILSRQLIASDFVVILVDVVNAKYGLPEHCWIGRILGIENSMNWMTEALKAAGDRADELPTWAGGTGKAIAERDQLKADKERLLKALGMCSCAYCKSHGDPTETDEAFEAFQKAHPLTKQQEAQALKSTERVRQRMLDTANLYLYKKALEQIRDKYASTEIAGIIARDALKQN